MIATGYVLTGGRSSRMGRDKALLPWRGVPLALHVARNVELAAGSVTLVGDPVRYQGLGLPVIADLHPGSGPIAGLEAALTHTSCEWNLVVACDMPHLRAGFLRGLLDSASRCGDKVVMAAGPDNRPQPLCAVWRRECVDVVRRAVAAGLRRMTDLLPLVSCLLVPVSALHFSNLNTPEDWAEHAAR